MLFISSSIFLKSSSDIFLIKFSLKLDFENLFIIFFGRKSLNVSLRMYLELPCLNLKFEGNDRHKSVTLLSKMEITG